MPKLYNFARMTTATTGTGTVTLGAAVSGFLTFALAGAADGDYVRYGIKDGTASEEGIGKYTASGTTLTRNVRKSTNSDALLNLSGSAEIYITAAAEDFPFPNNYLSGLTLSNDGTTPNTVLDIAAGVCADSTNVEMMRLSAFTKTTGAWAVGSGNGALDTGSVAGSAWYHVYVIERQDTGVVDVLFSLSASAPTMPTNCTVKRRIGSFLTSSSNIVAFSQFGDEFLWKTAVGDLGITSITDTVAHLQTLTVPTGVQVWALMSVFAYGNAGAEGRYFVSSPDENDQAAGVAVNNVGVFAGSATGVIQASELRTRTSTSAQVRYRSLGATGQLAIGTRGWIDLRGKLG